jgi:hypothetical protein
MFKKITFPRVLLVLVAILYLSIIPIVIYNKTNHPKVKSFDAPLTTTVSNVTLKKLSDDLDHGLYEIQIDDTLRILVFRSIESVSMIRVK